MPDKIDREQIQQDGEEYVTIRRAAELYDVSQGTVRNWIDRKSITTHQTGVPRPIYLKRSELDKLMEYEPVPVVRRVPVTLELDESLLAQVEALASRRTPTRAIVEASLRDWLAKQIADATK